MPELKCKKGSLADLGGGLYAFAGPTNVGVAARMNPGRLAEVYLIDAGESAEDAKKVCEACGRAFGPFAVKALICTHAHADHIGGAAWLKERYSCQVWATQGEKSCAESPELQAYTFYGALPLPEIDTPYFHAPRTRVDKIIRGGQKIRRAGFAFEFIPLPGHSLEMVGVLARGAGGAKAFFAGDGIFGRSMLARFWTPFIVDPKAFKESLGRIGKIEADFFVPSHGAVYDEADELVELNLISTISNEKCIEEILETPHTHEGLLKAFADKSGITLRLSQHMLIGSALRSYLTYLCKEGRARWFFKDNQMFWERAKKGADA